MVRIKLPHISPFIIKSLLILFIVSLSTNHCYTQNMPVPENIQAALLPKVLKYNPKFSGINKIKMLVVYNNNSTNSKDKFIKELENLMEIRAILTNELEKTIVGYDLVYFMPGTQEESFLCKRHKVLSVAGISQYIEKGQISLGFDIQNNKPTIFVNLTSLDEEGQSLSSDVLRIVKIYK